MGSADLSLFLLVLISMVSFLRCFFGPVDREVEEVKGAAFDSSFCMLDVFWVYKDGRFGKGYVGSRESSEIRASERVLSF